MASTPRPIRFGGERIGGTFRFELTGGRLCLDLVNSFDERQSGGRELLPTYDRLLEWSEQAGLLPRKVVARLHAAALRVPGEAEQALDEVRDFRERLYDFLGEISAGATPSKRSLEPLNRFIARSGQRRRLAYVDGKLEMTKDEDDLRAPLWPVVEDAVELLLDRGLHDRLRICAGSGCGWMFIDRSRRANRRWCDMSVCGNRAKARRFRASRRSSA